MASSRDYLFHILDQLSLLEGISYKPMMGEYIIYYKDKIAGGVYDDRFLVKAVESAIRYMPSAQLDFPYQEAKKMLVVDNVNDKEYLKGLFDAIYEELPMPKVKGRR